jgi:hypothetical protein
MEETLDPTKLREEKYFDFTAKFSDLLKSKTWIQGVEPEDAVKYKFIYIRDKKENDFVITNLNPHSEDFFNTFSLPADLISKPLLKVLPKVNPFITSDVLCNGLLKETGLNIKSRFAELFQLINTNFHLRMKEFCTMQSIPPKYRKIILGSELRSRSCDLMASLTPVTANSDQQKLINFNRILNSVFLSSIKTERIIESPNHEIHITDPMILRSRLVNVYEAVPSKLYCFTYAVYDINEIVNTISLRNYWFDIDTVRFGYHGTNKFYAIYQHEGVNNFLINLLTIDSSLSVNELGTFFLSYETPYKRGKKYIPITNTKDLEFLANERIIPSVYSSTSDYSSLTRMFRNANVSYSFSEAIAALSTELKKSDYKFTEKDRSLMIALLVCLNQDYGYFYRAGPSNKSVYDLPLTTFSRLGIYQTLIDRLRLEIANKLGHKDVDNLDFSKYTFVDKLSFVKPGT